MINKIFDDQAGLPGLADDQQAGLADDQQAGLPDDQKVQS